MTRAYTTDSPLGHNYRQEPAIKAYFTWAEIAEATRRGVHPGTDVPLPEAKDDRPGFTYKGDFQDYRDGAHFRGDRSPYVLVDVDLDEAHAGFSKKDATPEQIAQVRSDVEIILDGLTDFQRDFFFCKVSSSGCGFHAVLNCENLPADPEQSKLYEQRIFASVQERIDSYGLSHHFKVDRSLDALPRVFYISHDPGAIYNPGKTTDVSAYSTGALPTESAGYAPRAERDATDADRKSFLRFARFCLLNSVRMEYNDIVSLGWVHLALFSPGLERFVRNMRGFALARSFERRRQEGSVESFLKNHYKKVEKRIHNGRSTGVDSLYTMMERYDYTYSKELDPPGMGTWPSGLGFLGISSRTRRILQGVCDTTPIKAVYSVAYDMAENAVPVSEAVAAVGKVFPDEKQMVVRVYRKQGLPV